MVHRCQTSQPRTISKTHDRLESSSLNKLIVIYFCIPFTSINTGVTTAHIRRAINEINPVKIWNSFIRTIYTYITYLWVILKQTSTIKTLFIYHSNASIRFFRFFFKHVFSDATFPRAIFPKNCFWYQPTYRTEMSLFEQHEPSSWKTLRQRRLEVLFQKNKVIDRDYFKVTLITIAEMHQSERASADWFWSVDVEGSVSVTRSERSAFIIETSHASINNISLIATHPNL